MTGRYHLASPPDAAARTIDLPQYWVVGGAYRDLSFAALEEDSGRLHGPFPSYADALACWRRHSADTRSKASVRYSVVVSVPGPAEPRGPT